MIDYDEVCLICNRARGRHQTKKLKWRSKGKFVELWQDGLCPSVRNEYQPAWDQDIFLGALSGSPYADRAVDFRRVF